MRADRTGCAEVAVATDGGIVAEALERPKDEVSMNQKADKVENSRPYEPPTLKIIDLRPEEAVLGACKSFNAGGQSQSSCSITFCMNIGS